jgi:hypothetical protein
LNQSKSEVIRGHVQLLRWPQDCKSCETERRARANSESESDGAFFTHS